VAAHARRSLAGALARHVGGGTEGVTQLVAGYTVAGLKKDKSIHVLLEQLRVRLGSQAFEVLDHWDADLCAIGIARPESPIPLVYISTWRQPPGKYVVSLELSPERGSSAPYQSGGEHDGVDFEVLVSTIMRHLDLTDVGGLPK